MNFGEHLQELREDREISRKELSAYLNISVSALGMYEQGRREPNIETLIRIADYFNVSLDFLLGRTFSGNNVKELKEALHLKNEIKNLPVEYRELIKFMLEVNKK